METKVKNQIKKKRICFLLREIIAVSQRVSRDKNKNFECGFFENLGFQNLFRAVSEKRVASFVEGMMFFEKKIKRGMEDRYKGRGTL